MSTSRAARRRKTGVVAAALTMLIIAGCGFATTVRPDRPPLGVSNGTTLVVTLTVNGEKVAESTPGAPQPSIDVAALPPLPWDVEALSASGRVLTGMHVEPGQVSVTTNADGGAESGVLGRVDLSCERLTIWAGANEPSGPAPVGAVGKPGDCNP